MAEKQLYDLYSELKARKAEKRAYLEEVDPNVRQKRGFNNMSFIYSDEWKNKKYEYAIHTATRVAMSNIASVVNQIGWEKYCEGMETFQFPSVQRRAMAMKEKYDLHDDTMMDVKMHTLTWSTGCGFTGGAVQYYDEDRVEGMAYWCPQVAMLEEMGLECGNLGIWCDSFDGCIMTACKPNLSYTHVYCLADGDKVCRHIVEEVKEPFMKNPEFTRARKPGEPSLYETIMGNKAEKKTRFAPEPDCYDLPNWRTLPWLTAEYNNEQIEKRGCETKWHIATDALILGGHLLGWQKFINVVNDEHTPGYTRAANQRRLDINLLTKDLRQAANLVFFGMAGLPFEHRLTKYTPKQILGYAEKCPIAEAAAEMGVDAADVSLWCDYYKNIEVHSVNPEYNITHTHCIAAGDPYCRFIIE